MRLIWSKYPLFTDPSCGNEMQERSNIPQHMNKSENHSNTCNMEICFPYFNICGIKNAKIHNNIWVNKKNKHSNIFTIAEWLQQTVAKLFVHYRLSVRPSKYLSFNSTSQVPIKTYVLLLERAKKLLFVKKKTKINTKSTLQS